MLEYLMRVDHIERPVFEPEVEQITFFEAD